MSNSLEKLKGMGAIVDTNDEFVTFRVWAPNVKNAYVAGTFNNWDYKKNPLSHENNGYWSANVKGAKVNDKYKFVLETPYKNELLWKIDPYAKATTNSVGKGIIIDPNSFDWEDDSFITPSWNELVIYELHLGSFYDKNRDDNKPATIKNAIEKLDYLRDLGINAIEIMPFYEFPSNYSWGYNLSHIFAIEEAYGSVDDFKKFVKEAHKRDIAVIIDVVYNHFGPSDLDLWQFNGWSIYDDKGGIYFYNDNRAFTHWGHTRPDYGRDEIRQFIRDNIMMWIEEYRVDGFRFDSTSNIRAIDNGNGDIADGWSLMQWLNDEKNRKFPYKITIAEDMQNNKWITKKSSDGGAGFDSQWDSFFYHTLKEAILAIDDKNRDMYKIKDILYNRFNGNAFERVVYSESHDEVSCQNGKSRLPENISRCNADNWYAKKRSTLASALVFTSPAIPMIFQGQEFLEYGCWNDNKPIDWSHLDKYYGIHLLYRDLIKLRRNWYNNTRGLKGQYINVYHINNNDKVVAFHRWENGGEGDDVLVVANFSIKTFSNYTLGFPRYGLWKVRFNSDWEGYGKHKGAGFSNNYSYDTFAYNGEKDKMSYNANISIASYSVIILSQ